MDGVSNSRGCGARPILANPDGVVAKYVIRFDFKASNNEAEYKALIIELGIAKELDIGVIRVFTDSQLVAAQVRGKYEAQDPTMARYLSKLRSIVTNFKLVEAL